MPTLPYTDAKAQSRADAKARGAAAQMARAESIADSAERLAIGAIKEGAMAVLRRGPLASEYVQAMGSWSFKVIIPLKEGGFYEDDIGRNERDWSRLAEAADDELQPEYAECVEPFLNALREFRDLHETYNATFGGIAAGVPMRFKATGPVTTDW